MKKLLDYIIPNIVDNPEEVIITESETPSGTVISIQVHPDDMGRIIGKAGKVIKAIRQIARVISVRQNKKVHIDIVDKDNEQPVSESAPQEQEEVPQEQE